MLNNQYLKRLYLVCIVVTILTIPMYNFMYYRFMKLWIKLMGEEQRTKYIYLWTDSAYEPFNYLMEGRDVFLTKNCTYTNCYVTSNITFLGEDYTQFDVIAFNGPDLNMYNYKLPKRRSPHQKYVFLSSESSHNYRLCSEKYNNYFNWTWTYKFDSDIRWRFMVIRDINDNIIGPNKDMHWMNIADMKPVSKELKAELKEKKNIAAWIVSKCETKSKRELLVNELQNELKKINRSYNIDVFGKCGLSFLDYCPDGDCHLFIKDYYFYLALEDSFCEDYVTDSILLGLQNNAVPVVFGGANYTMFMPDGIYLNALKLQSKKLAQQMHEAVVNRTKYEDYFRWKNHYTYHKTAQSFDDDYCQFCRNLNDEILVKKKTVIKDFVSWWNPAGLCLVPEAT